MLRKRGNGKMKTVKGNLRPASGLLAVVLALALLLGACGKITPARLQGTWTGESSILGVVTKTEYTFNEDGTGTISGALGIGVAMHYTLEDDTLTVVTDTAILSQTLVYTVGFEKGDLLLTEANGDVLRLTRQ